MPTKETRINYCIARLEELREELRSPVLMTSARQAVEEAYHETVVEALRVLAEPRTVHVIKKE